MRHPVDGAVFSKFAAHNPARVSSYRVTIGGAAPAPGDNYRAFPDLATNLLGTCKQIEFVL